MIQTNYPNKRHRRQDAVVYIITSLSVGGAQKVLLQLLASPLKQQYPPAAIIVLRKVSGLEAAFTALKIPVIYLEVEKPWRVPGRLFAIMRWLKQQDVRFVYSMMHHANLLAVLLQWLMKWPGGKPLALIWSMHDTPLPGLYKRLDHRFFLWLTQKLSNCPQRIVLVSARSRERYIELNYPQDKLSLIPNGVQIDPHDSRTLAMARREVREELGLPPDALLIGSLTRYVIAKDIPNMLEAFSLLSVEQPMSFLLLAGEGMEPGNAALTDLLAASGLADRVLLLGVRSDARRLLRALDIATLSSRSEALPLFMVEAMAACIPCVATNVGDIALLFGETGCLVAPGDSAGLAKAWRDTLSLSGAERWLMVSQARERVVKQFSQQQMVARHRDLFAALGSNTANAHARPET